MATVLSADDLSAFLDSAADAARSSGWSSCGRPVLASSSASSSCFSLVREAITFVRGGVDLATCGPRGGSRDGDSFDIRTLLVATLGTTFVAMLVADPDRARHGRLPLRVRQPRGPQGRSSRSSRSWPASRRWSSASSPSPGSLPTSSTGSSTRRRARTCWSPASAWASSPIPLVASISEDALRSVPAGAPRGVLRRRRQEGADRLPGRASPPRSPVWWPRSSSPSPVPSARRWWSPSPPAGRARPVFPPGVPVARTRARTRPHHDRRDGDAGGRVRPGGRPGHVVPEPVLRRAAAVRAHPRRSTSLASRIVRRLRQAY